MTTEELAAMARAATSAPVDAEDERLYSCAWCGTEYSVEEPGHAPTPLCHCCAHEAARVLGEAVLRMLGAS